jgi:hypothetical protein
MSARRVIKAPLTRDKYITGSGSVGAGGGGARPTTPRLEKKQGHRAQEERDCDERVCGGGEHMSHGGSDAPTASKGGLHAA